VEDRVRAARYALTVLQNRRGAVPRPSWCTYLVSYRCNARCKMCDSWRMKPGDEMSVDDAARVFAKIGPLDVVRLTGGEPFLRSDLAELARVIFDASNPLVLHVTTNGSLADEVWRFTQALDDRRARLAFMVSFDGDVAVHDESRGPDVTHARALATVKLLAARGLRVSVNHTVISPASMRDALAIRRAVPDGVDVHTVIAYADSATYGLKLRGKRADHLIVPRGYPLHPALEGADVTTFVEDELARESRAPGVESIGKTYYLRGLLARLRGSAHAGPKCVALRSHLRLLPDGRVPVCQFNGEIVGDLRTQTLDEIWSGASAERRWVDACPGCWAECEVMPSAIYTGALARGAVEHFAGQRSVSVPRARARTPVYAAPSKKICAE
jgi:MoaA/NifB/PqqE/SkfB family radical SAM enzyme